MDEAHTLARLNFLGPRVVGITHSRAHRVPSRKHVTHVTRERRKTVDDSIQLEQLRV